MKQLLVATSILFLLFSCEKEVYHNIPKNEKPLLKDKDTVVFIDKENQMLDTFLIKRTDEYQIYDKNYYYENILVWYKKMGESTSVKDFFIHQSLSTSISINGIYFPTIYKPTTHENDNTIDINVNGINYSSIFVFQASDFPDSIPNTIYYSYQYGIIRYDFSDGRSYELINQWK
ncbi:MAG TPA: hypothetical protein PLB87_09280 [Prolixibacteraceae bacterium]|nr:hypothetical protein [Prolixibacteraceae bacterium]